MTRFHDELDSLAGLPNSANSSALTNCDCGLAAIVNFTRKYRYCASDRSQILLWVVISAQRTFDSVSRGYRVDRDGGFQEIIHLLTGTIEYQGPWLHRTSTRNRMMFVNTTRSAYASMCGPGRAHKRQAIASTVLK